ncbi:MAG: hypothetical protein WCW35_02770 [Bacteroidota bacterium]|jgi:hypothetical protein
MKKKYLLFLVLMAVVQVVITQKKQPNQLNAVQTTITVDQVFENGGRITGSQVKHHNGSGWDSWAIPAYPNFNEWNNETMWGDTSILSNQKFRHWYINGGTNTLNHQDVNVQSATPNWISTFKTANNATIQALLIDGGSAGQSGNPGVVQIADPWLIDNTDAKGKLNRSTNAVFRTPNIGTNNIGISNV